jgi:hypothetical protein
MTAISISAHHQLKHTGEELLLPPQLHLHNEALRFIHWNDRNFYIRPSSTEAHRGRAAAAASASSAQHGVVSVIENATDDAAPSTSLSTCIRS